MTLAIIEREVKNKRTGSGNLTPLLSAQILAVSEPELAQKLDDKRKKDAEAVLEKDAGIAQRINK